MRVAVLGLGAMGGRMAARLAAAGHAVTGWSRTPARAAALADRGVAIAADRRAAVAEAELVLSMVRDDAAARAVWLDPEAGALAASAADALVVEASTVTPGWARTLAAAAAARGLAMLEAPVVGSRPQAEAGALVVLAGGEATAIDRARPALAAFAATIVPVGPIGTGAAAKLAVNALFAVQAAALAEQLAILAASGVAPAAAMGWLGGLPVTSPAAKALGEMMAAGRFAPLFPIDLAEKDLGYAAALAAGQGVTARLTEAARASLAAAAARGHGEAHLSALFRLHG